ncbi:ammonium transporter [Asticcacaulis sp. DW145]|uniref:ammonium transporter n=1 Tax=Asticcacaulis sp. DW145 TaxID=3095608 RepID=UPI00308F47E8|nr:ammonium transporter [Asticcacaulis sp. DW145]
MKTWIKFSKVLAASAALLMTAPVVTVAHAAAVTSEAAVSEAAPASEAATPTAAAEAPAPVLLAHQKPLTLDAAGTAWIIVATALVLMMTMPGLALFYGGMVRKKNIIATVTQSVAVTCVVAVLWFVVGYSLSFGVADKALFGIPGETVNKFIGGFDVFLLKGVTTSTAYASAPGLPEMLWIAYQMTFAIITPALITGAFAERIKLSGLLLFMALWSVFIYAPICHQVWGGGYLAAMHVLDFAGGAVVHVNSGVAGLVAAIFLGRRKGYGTEEMTPNNLIFVMIGASLLFVGWIGFNAGSEWAADGIAAAALLNTILAACAAGLTWKLVEWTIRRKPSLLGILSGIVAGLVAITPAAGFVNPTGALIIGLIAGPFCYTSAVWVKRLLGYDDSLDAFGIHGAGGFLGAILTAVFADPSINPLAEGASVGAQFMGLVFTILWSAIGTFIILVICKFTTGLRVSEADEEAGLDSALHDEVHH